MSQLPIKNKLLTKGDAFHYKANLLFPICEVIMWSGCFWIVRNWDSYFGAQTFVLHLLCTFLNFRFLGEKWILRPIGVWTKSDAWLRPYDIPDQTEYWIRDSVRSRHRTKAVFGPWSHYISCPTFGPGPVTQCCPSQTHIASLKLCDLNFLKDNPIPVPGSATWHFPPMAAYPRALRHV